MLKFLVESPYERKLYRLGGDVVVIGRSRASDIPLLDERAKKRHAEVRRVGGGYRLVDLTDGLTRRNGEPAGECDLRVGDRIEIGSTVLTLQAILAARDAGTPGRTGQISGPVSGPVSGAVAGPKSAPEPGGKPASPPLAAVLISGGKPPPGGESGAHSVRIDPAVGDRLLAAGFRSILDINKRLLTEKNEGGLLATIMDAAIDLTGAERGFLVLAAEKGLEVKVARNLEGDPLSEPDMQISRNIIRQAVASKRAVLSEDAGRDERWSGMESVVALKLRSVLSVPLLDPSGVIGALYLDNRLEKGIFTSRHVSLLEAFADQASLAIVSARMTAALRRRGKELVRKTREVEQLNARLSAELSRAMDDLRTRQGELEFRYDYQQIVGRSPGIQAVLRDLDKVTDLNVPVFIEGESGTGKELVARALHFNGPRRKGRFVSENCSAVPETLIEKVLFGHVKGAFTGADSDAPGLFELANEGTLFLDEVGDMSPEMQKKILRVIQEGEVRRVGDRKTMKVEPRIVCATNRDVEAMREAGTFREDLFWRLVVVRIRMPPLRERQEDIPLLVDHFLRLYAAEMACAPKTLESGALDLLTRYPWPGNIRELMNEIRRAVALGGDRIGAESLSERVRTAPPSPDLKLGGGRTLKDVVEEVERTIIAREIERQVGNKTKTAEVLGLSRLGLRNKMQRYGLE